MEKSKPVLLIVDDDKALRESLSMVLGKKFDVLEAENGNQGRLQAELHKPQLILLDINMAGGDGISLCKILRSSPLTMAIPIILMTGRNDPSIRVDGFLSGADDFLAKPFLAPELLARIESKLRRASEATEVVRFSGLVIEASQLAVSLDGHPLAVGFIEFKILQLLARQASNIVKRTELENFIWGTDLPASRTLDAHISSLRRKLSASAIQIRAVYGEGYILEKKVAS